VSKAAPLVATAWAPVNIALIKHWGYSDAGHGKEADLPARPSLSLTLDHGSTTTVTWRDQPDHRILLNGIPLAPTDGEKAAASFAFLEAVRKTAKLGSLHASVQAVSEVPLSAGFASSAAGGAALTVAALEAAGLGPVDPGDRLDWCRRLGSVSALRSLRGGVVRLDVDHEAQTLALGSVELGGVENDLDLMVLSCLVQGKKKSVSSSAGHARVTTSPYWTQFARDALGRLGPLVDGLVAGDLAQVGALIEADALAMHAVMLTSHPPIVYATDATWRVWHQVVAWRREGAPSPRGYCTLDAGPNPHILCTRDDADELATRLMALPDVQRIFRSGVAPHGARRITAPDTAAPSGHSVIV
jgi:diphosphomevalonate decarboxylase